MDENSNTITQLLTSPFLQLHGHTWSADFETPLARMASSTLVWWFWDASVCPETYKMSHPVREPGVLGFSIRQLQKWPQIPVLHLLNLHCCILLLGPNTRRRCSNRSKGGQKDSQSAETLPLWTWAENWGCSMRRSLWKDLIVAFQCLKRPEGKLERDLV